MAILDCNNLAIEGYDDFPNDPNVSNLEIGAGKGFFGKKFYPNCYLIDDNKEIGLNYSHFLSLPDYSNNLNKCHFLDYFCDFNQTGFKGKKFNNIVICNPYGYGFKSVNYAIEFLSNVDQILINKGKLTVLSNSRNVWGAYRRVSKYLEQTISEISSNFVLSEKNSIDEEHKYRVDMDYFSSGLEIPTYPNEFYSLTKSN